MLARLLRGSCFVLIKKTPGAGHHPRVRADPKRLEGQPSDLKTLPEIGICLFGVKIALTSPARAPIEPPTSSGPPRRQREQKRAGTLPGNRISAGPNADRGYGRSQGISYGTNDLAMGIHGSHQPGPLGRSAGMPAGIKGHPGYTRYPISPTAWPQGIGPGFAESGLFSFDCRPF